MADVARNDREIIYIGDPMCSWCWGFAPVLEELREEFGDAADFSVIVGGLRPGEFAQIMDEDTKAFMRSHWEQVERNTGQPFDYSFFEWEDFLYDTEPAARAVVTVRQLTPEKTYPFFKSLQEAFYAGAVDITQEENYAPILEKHGIDETEFKASFDAEETKEATYGDFSRASTLGVTGFPSVLLRKGEKMGLLSAGYRPYKHLRPAISGYFES